MGKLFSGFPLIRGARNTLGLSSIPPNQEGGHGGTAPTKGGTRTYSKSPDYQGDARGISEE